MSASLGRGIVRARESEAFERALVGTARLHLVYGALLVAGLLW